MTISEKCKSAKLLSQACNYDQPDSVFHSNLCLQLKENIRVQVADSRFDFIFPCRIFLLKSNPQNRTAKLYVPWRGRPILPQRQSLLLCVETSVRFVDYVINLRVADAVVTSLTA